MSDIEDEMFGVKYHVHMKAPDQISLCQQERIEAVKQDLKLSKQKTALLMREYQDLLNAKMTMEIEIATYRWTKRYQTAQSQKGTLYKLDSHHVSGVSLFLTGLHCLFNRKLIEGEDNRLSPITGKLPLTDHLHLTNSSPTDRLSSLTPVIGSLKLEGPKCTVNAETPPAAVSIDNPGDGNPQATEKSERKTLLIR